MQSPLLAGLLIAGFVAGPSEAPEALAQKAAEAWLRLTDAGQFSESWTDAAPLFQKAVTKDQWKQSLEAYRAPLGKLLSRTFKSAQLRTAVPGGPDGKYVVLQYSTSFENKKEATETVTPMLAPDGTWKVSGYFVK